MNSLLTGLTIYCKKTVATAMQKTPKTTVESWNNTEQRVTTKHQPDYGNPSMCSSKPGTNLGLTLRWGIKPHATEMAPINMVLVGQR